MPENVSPSAKELEQAYVPLMPVEKKLNAWSLILGVILLGILIVVSYTLFPGSF